jgi:hypothetical protein
VGGFSSKGGRLSFLMSMRGFEGVDVRRERLSGVICMPEGENPLSSEKSFPPLYLIKVKIALDRPFLCPRSPFF